jgi:glycosyltransferase involved in cell wall biosynthesis
VIGHVGRFHPQKNHALWLRILAAFAEREPRAVGLLVGDGALRPAIERQARAAGLAGRLRFAGVRADVPQLMQAAMDVFLFPSRHEGLGLVLVEAQAAGLACVISDVIPPEADALPERVLRLPPSAPPALWAQALEAALQRGRLAGAAQHLAGTAYAIDTSLALYTAAYDGTPAAALPADPRSCAASPA